MAVVVSVVVVRLRWDASLIVHIGIVMMAMIVVMDMETRCRSVIVQMPVHTLHRRPGELEGDD